MTIPNQNTIDFILERGIAEVIIASELAERLKEGTSLRLKMGFDPSRPDIHLGHVVGLRKLRQFQELGHQVILIVGDWTAQIGDPSGQSATRSMLSAEDVRANAITYMEQFFQVIDREKVTVVWQSEWYGKFSLEDVFALTSKFTVAQMLARDDFAKRYRAERPIAITELMYPLLQAYDSIVIQADVEFGGTDQKFNLLMGRELQQILGQRQQQCITMPLLPGTDGIQKMSKSLDNYIGITDHPNQMFGKLMSIPDDLLLLYFELLTDVPSLEITNMHHGLEKQTVHPMELKKRLGSEIVSEFHSPQAATAARNHFERVIQRGEAPEEANILIAPRRTGENQIPIPELVVSTNSGEKTDFTPNLTVSSRSFNKKELTNYATRKGMPESSVFSVYLPDLLAEIGVVQSKSQVKRLIAQEAIELDGEKITSDIITTTIGSTIKIGKRNFIKIVPLSELT